MSVRRGIAGLVVVMSLLGGVAGSSVWASSAPKEKVGLIEFEVQPALAYIAKGKTKFIVKNNGTEEHEFVVVRAEDAEALPTAEDGSVDEDQIAKKDQVGELEEIEPGKTKKKTFKLKAGSYVLFCNIVETESDGTVVSHFAEGMHTTLDAS